MNIKISKETTDKLAKVMLKGAKKVGEALLDATLSIGAEILVGYAVNKIVEGAEVDAIETTCEVIEEEEYAGE